MATSAGGVTEGAVLEVLRGIKDPDQGKDVVTLGLVRDLVIDGPLVSLTLAFTNQTPAAKVALHSGASRAVSQMPGVGKVQIKMGSASAPAGAGAHAHDHAHAHGPQGAPAGPQRSPEFIPEVSHTVAVSSGQGRRGQVHGGRQPGPGPQAGRRHRRPGGRGHLRARRAAHDGREGQAGDVRQQDHPRRGPRREDHVDRAARGRARGARVARPDDPLRGAAVPARRELGAARLPRVRHAAGHGRRAALALAGDPAVRRGDGDDAAGRGPPRRAQGPRHVPEAERPGDRDRREHEPLHRARHRQALRDLRRGRRRPHRPGVRRAAPGADPARDGHAQGRGRRRADRRRPAPLGAGPGLP